MILHKTQILTCFSINSKIKVTQNIEDGTGSRRLYLEMQETSPCLCYDLVERQATSLSFIL